MKNFEMSRIARISMLVIALTVITGTSVTAQSNTDTTGTSASAQSNTGYTGTSRTQSTGAERDNGTDWGWLGLVGALGLAGLIPKKRHVETHDDNNRNSTR